MGFCPRTMYQVPARVARGSLATPAGSPSPSQPCSPSGRLASSMQCCSCNVKSCKPSEHQLRHLDVASVEVVERVRLVVADAVEGARLPCGTLRLSKNLQPGQIHRGRDRPAPLDIGGLSDRQKFQRHTFYISDSGTFGSRIFEKHNAPGEHARNTRSGRAFWGASRHLSGDG